jgi:hypothetical protein
MNLLPVETQRERFTMPKKGSEPSTENDDTLVWGAKAIGAALNLADQKTFYQLERGRIEGAFKMGARWAAPRRILRRIATGEGQAPPPINA